MKRILMTFPLAFAMLSGCGNDSPVAKFIVTDQKVPLTDWPDSAYIANLDSILAMEPIKKDTTQKANIAMNAHEAPVFNLPKNRGLGAYNPTVKEKLEALKNKKKVEQGNTSNRNAQARTAEKGTKTDNGAEVFANRFTDGLSKLQSDPNNASLYRMVSANDGDDIMKLLRRTYGAGVGTLPRFFVIGGLKSVNSGLNLESLNAGDKVKIPKL